MNNKRRVLLKDASILLERVSTMVEQALEQEQDCLDNMPENLQMTDRYESMEAVVDRLEDAAADLDSAKDRIAEAVA